MKRCLITGELFQGEGFFSRRGLKLLAPKLKQLSPLSLSAEEQRREARARAGKMSLQGVQPKFSARLNIKEGRFEIVDRNGRYIFKPQSDFLEVPQNEAITMTMAAMVGIEVPLHGLLPCRDGSFTYFVQRFDREGKGGKLAVEDFAQLSGKTRETKYASSMEQVAQVISNFCTFPLLESIKLFRLTIFNFLIGNEDMHLKNFSLMTREGKVELSPAYDLVNTTIAQPYRVDEEFALPLNGKKRKLERSDLIDSFGAERLGLRGAIMNDILSHFSRILPAWRQCINESFLSDEMRQRYLELIDSRSKRILQNK